MMHIFFAMSSRISVVSNIVDFAKKFPALSEKEKEGARFVALKRYFAKGGVINLSSLPEEGNWPEIVYPTQSRLKQLLNDATSLRRHWNDKKGGWQGQFDKAKRQNLVCELKKFADPLFWRHLAKYYSNRDYRKDADAVKLPVSLVSEKRWKPMIQMFVQDLDYRKQLTETVQNSIVYANDKRVAKYAQELRSFRMQSSSREIEGIAKQLTEVETDIEMLQQLLKWAK